MNACPTCKRNECVCKTFVKLSKLTKEYEAVSIEPIRTDAIPEVPEPDPSKLQHEWLLEVFKWLKTVRKVLDEGREGEKK